MYIGVSSHNGALPHTGTNSYTNTQLYQWDTIGVSRSIDTSCVLALIMLVQYTVYLKTVQ